MSTPPILFDRSLLRARRRRAHALGVESFLIDRTADELAERLQAVKRRFPVALDLGTSGDRLRRTLLADGQVDQVVACDPLAHLHNPCAGPRVTADEEMLPFAAESFDLVVSVLALHWINDLPGTLAQIRHALKPDGLLLAALLGGETLTELRQCLAIAEAEIEGGVSPRIAPFVEVRALGSLLQRAGLALPVTDLVRITVRYGSLLDLFRDLRRMGATNVLTERRRTPLRRATLARTAELYAERFADSDGRLRATFDFLWMSGWAPHESQQQPLRPGAAQRRLADALGTQEQPAGEKTGPRRQ